MRHVKLFFTLIFMALLLPAVGVQAKTCEFTINANDMLEYDKSTMRVAPDCDSVTLTLNNTGSLPRKQMGHNWVLAETSHWKAVAQASMTAGLENGYISDDERILVNTDLIGGGESTSITFDVAMLDRTKDYRFFCSFPGHYVTMNGAFILETDS